MSTKTSFVNEFKLGIYAYESLYANTSAPRVSSFLDGNHTYAIPQEAKDYITTRSETIVNENNGNISRRSNGIGYIPFEYTQKLEEVSDVTTDVNGKLVNDGDTSYYPRNIYFSNFFNDHGINVITNDREVGNFKVINGLFNNQPVLCADGDTNKVVLVTRAGSSYQGVHFMVIEKSGISGTLEDQVRYYDNRTATQLKKDGEENLVGNTFVTYLTSSTSETQKTRASTIETEVKGFDSMLDARIFEHYLGYSNAEEGIEAVTIKDATLKASIEAAKTKMEVDQAIDNIKSSVANLKTIEEELSGYRTELKNEIANYASDKSYSSQNQDKVDMIIYNASTAINNAKSLKEMQEIVKNAKAEIDLIPTKEQELQSVRAEAIDKYVEYITLLEIDTNEIIGLEQLITLLKDNINKQNSVQKINAALESAKNETYLHVINHYATLYVKHVESTFPLTNYEHEYKSQVQALINSIKENITTSTTKEQLDAKVVSVMEQIKEIPTIQSKLESSKAVVREYLNSLLTDDLTDEQYAKVEELVETKLAELEEASTEYEIDVVKSSAELEYDEIITEEDDSSSSTNCQFASIKQIITLTVMLGLLVVVLRKRK